MPQRPRDMMYRLAVRAQTAANRKLLLVRYAQLLRTPRSPCPVDLAAQLRIVVVRLDGLGDCVMTTSFLQELRDCAPRAEITVIVQPVCHGLLSVLPTVDRCLAYAWRRWPLETSGSQIAARRWSRRHLTPPYDLAIVPRPDTDVSGSVSIALASLAPQRWAITERHSCEKALYNKGFDTFYTRVAFAPAGVHEIDASRSLLDGLGTRGRAAPAPMLRWPRDADDSVESMLRELPAADGVVAVCLSAGHPRRLWPVERFAEVARGLLGLRQSLGVAVLGGPAEVSAAERACRLVGGGNVRSFAGRLDLPRTAALLARCRLYVGCDTGVTHMAAAVGCPVVAVSCHPIDGDATGAQSPERFGPRGPGPVTVLQPAATDAGCHSTCLAPVAHCILKVSSTRVLDACRRLL